MFSTLGRSPETDSGVGLGIGVIRDMVSNESFSSQGM